MNATTHNNNQVTRFSPTALNTYLDCARKWDWQFRQRIEFEEAPSAQLFLGNAVHVALAALHKLPVAVRDEAMAHRLLRSAWGRAERAGLFLSDEDEIMWGQRALKLLSNYCGGWQLDVRPLDIEAWVRYQLRGGPLLSGKADRIDVARTDPTLIEVVDYKTGKRRLDGDDLRDEPACAAVRVGGLANLRPPRLPGALHLPGRALRDRVAVGARRPGPRRAAAAPPRHRDLGRPGAAGNARLPLPLVSLRADL